MIKCDKCSKPYNVELSIPDFIWKEINTEDHVNLCSICIMTGIEDIFANNQELIDNPDWVLMVKKVVAYWKTIDDHLADLAQEKEY